MGYARGSGVSGLAAAFADEAKWFADQRAPYPIERSVRGTVSAPFDGRPVPRAFLDGLRGTVIAVLDDEVDSAEPRRRRPRRARRGDDSAAIAELRAEVRALSATVWELSCLAAGPTR